MEIEYSIMINKKEKGKDGKRGFKMENYIKLMNMKYYPCC